MNRRLWWRWIVIVRLVLPALLTLLALSACGGGSPAPTPTPPSRATSAPAITASSATPPIVIEKPAASATLSVPFEISGTANVPDGALSIAVADASGTLCEHDLRATPGAGARATWRTTMSFAPPSTPGNVTIRAFSRSPQDGAAVNVVTRTVQLGGDVPNIVIAEPRCAAELAAESMLLVSGTARVFEASLTLELRAQTGAIVAAQHLTADAGGPATGRWSTQVDLTGIPAGRYDLVAYDLSPRDGKPENIFSIPVRITV